ncbi:hypothetical protein FAIPA1_280020 [Frankia sp. AiPs1]
MAVEREEHRLGVVGMAAVISPGAPDGYPAAIAVAASSVTPQDRLLAAVTAAARQGRAAPRGPCALPAGDGQ